MRDLKNNLDGVSSIDPASYTATTNGSGVDLRDFDSAMVVFQAGSADTGSGNETYTPGVEESDDNSSFSAVAASDLEGSPGNMTANSVQRVGYKGAKRYVRAVLTLGGTTPSIDASALVIRGLPHLAPL
ncbi:MAG: hypothetical protein OEZ51_07110 [Nitrospinota bacterium]|nr:hypothetical protein [Nitrospinota bacterium]